jgi:hypothetical protein
MFDHRVQEEGLIFSQGMGETWFVQTRNQTSLLSPPFAFSFKFLKYLAIFQIFWKEPLHKV